MSHDGLRGGLEASEASIVTPRATDSSSSSSNCSDCTELRATLRILAQQMHEKGREYQPNCYAVTGATVERWADQLARLAAPPEEKG